MPRKPSTVTDFSQTGVASCVVSAGASASAARVMTRLASALSGAVVKTLEQQCAQDGIHLDSRS